jgi:hypothetical protein
MSTGGESYQGIFKHIGRSLVAGVVATGVLRALKLTSGTIPQRDTIRFLDRVARPHRGEQSPYRGQAWMR